MQVWKRWVWNLVEVMQITVYLKTYKQKKIKVTNYNISEHLSYWDPITESTTLSNCGTTLNATVSIKNMWTLYLALNYPVVTNVL